MKEGDVYKTNYCGDLKVVKIHAYNNVEVEFLLTGTRAAASKWRILEGVVGDKYYPKICGVGFTGEGCYSWINQTKAYSCWSGMLRRCYSEDSLKRSPTYRGCFVTKEWHNFQIFCEWYIDNYPKDGRDYQLDKDILFEGNKEYSPEKCIFVTHRDNAVKAAAKHYTFISPEGGVVELYNLSDFCRENELDSGCMGRVNNGTRRIHKGWMRYDPVQN